MKAQSYSLPCLMTRKTHIPTRFQLPFSLRLSFNLEKIPFCYFSFLHCIKTSNNSTMLSIFKFHLRLFLPTLPLIPCNLIPGNISVFSLPPQMHFVLLLFFSNSLSSVSRYSLYVYRLLLPYSILSNAVLFLSKAFSSLHYMYIL